jgi:Trypsin-co-occurring domain 2
MAEQELNACFCRLNTLRFDLSVLREAWMAGEDAGPAGGLGLADAIALLRDDLLKARAEGGRSDIQLPVDSMTVELTVTAAKSLDGRAGFTVPLVGLELGGGAGREQASGHKVTVVFGGPVDREGNPVKVASAAEALPG